MELTLEQKLKCPFPSNQVHWRVGATTKDKTKAIPLAYVDARDVMERLDKAVGAANWQCRYPLADSGLLICEIGIRQEVFDPHPDHQIPDPDKWIWKANGAGDTQVEAEKGKASDAFKRAAVLWGIGQYLYSIPNQWVEIDQYKKLKVVPQLPYNCTVKGYMESLKKEQAK